MKIEIEYKTVNLEIEFDYTPPEAMVMYYSDISGHPGAPSEAHIESIKVKGVEIYDLLEDKIEEIEELILEKHEQEYYEER